MVSLSDLVVGSVVECNYRGQRVTGVLRWIATGGNNTICAVQTAVSIVFVPQSACALRYAVCGDTVYDVNGNRVAEVEHERVRSRGRY